MNIHIIHFSNNYSSLDNVSITAVSNSDCCVAVNKFDVRTTKVPTTTCLPPDKIVPSKDPRYSSRLLASSTVVKISTQPPPSVPLST